MRKLLRVLLFVAVIASLAQSAHALYQWVDENGILHISDFPPPAKYLPKEEPPAPETPAPTPAPVKPASPPPAVPQTAPASPAPKPVPAPVTAPRTTIPAPSTRAAATAQTAPSTTVQRPASAPTATAQAVPRQPVPITAPPPTASKPSPFTREEQAAAGLIAAFLGGFMMIIIGIAVVFYVYFSLCLYKIAQKARFEAAWAAWVPILQVWPVLGSAGKPVWWFIFFFVPLINIIVGVYVWMCISENLGKSKWLGLLTLVPIANLILPGYLAFSGSD
jgi:hypothetical protein